MTAALTLAGWLEPAEYPCCGEAPSFFSVEHLGPDADVPQSWQPVYVLQEAS